MKTIKTEPIFLRKEVARILNVTPLTISNREKKKLYPQPNRDLNGYRVYSLNDLMNLQLRTYSHIDTRPIISAMYDKGWTNPKECIQIIDSALTRTKSSLV